MFSSCGRIQRQGKDQNIGRALEELGSHPGNKVFVYSNNSKPKKSGDNDGVWARTWGGLSELQLWVAIVSPCCSAPVGPLPLFAVYAQPLFNRDISCL